MNNKLQAGGTLGSDKYYVKRQADDLLFESLKQSQFCYVLAARQMGKSSLMIRVGEELTGANFAVAKVDITAIGTHQVTARQFYNSLWNKIAQGLSVPFSVEIFDFENFSLQQNFQTFIEYILGKKQGHICVFFDEIDKILDLNLEGYSSDDFFSFIRYIKNLSASEPQFSRINFVVLGVATPSDLIRSKERTPFNIGTKIHLSNFTTKEAQIFLEAIHDKFDDPQEALVKILDWTGGQPYLTQAFCEKIGALDDGNNSINKIDDIASEFILNAREEHNLSNISNRILLNKEYNVEMLLLLGKILNGEKIRLNVKDKAQDYLKLTGAIIEKDGVLIYANKLYKEVYNLSWARDNISKFKIPFLEELAIWEESGGKTANLLTGSALEKGLKWKRKFEELPEMHQDIIDEQQRILIEEYLEKSEEEEKIQKALTAKKSRLFRRVAGSVITLLIFGLGIAIYFLNEARKENQFKEDMEIASLEITELVVWEENGVAFKKYLKGGEFAYYLKNLSSLYLWNISNLSTLEGLSNLSNLSSLYLWNISNLSTLEGLSNLSNLSSLDLSSLDNLSTLEGLSNLSNLSSLDLRYLDNLSTLEGLSNLPNLSSLDLRDLHNLSTLEGLSNVPNLSSLDLSSLDNLSTLEGLSNVSNLSSLYLRSLDNLSTLEGLSNVPNLSSLYLSSLDNLSMLEGLSNVPNLSFLYLSSLDNLSMLEGLSNVPNLSSLYLWNISNLSTLEGLSNVPNLSSLSLMSLDNLSTLEGLSNLPNLSSLSLMSLDNLSTLEGLSNVLNLSSLSLMSLDDLSTLEGLSNVPNLSSLYLSYLYNLSTLEDLSNVPNLLCLSLRSLDNLSTLEGIEKLDSLKKLTIDSKLLDKLDLEISLDTLFVFYSVLEDYQVSEDRLKQEYKHLFSKHKFIGIVD